MTRTAVVLPLRIGVWLAFPIFLALSAHVHAQAVDRRPTLTVIVDDRSTDGAADIGIAKTRAGYLFDEAGIRIAWQIARPVMAGTNDGRDVIRVVVLDGGVDTDVATDPVLGFAVPSANRIYVYYDRAQRLALGKRAQPGWFLGDVIAHEITHVLLPDIAHTQSGVMAAALRPDPQHPPAFTSGEARALRARLGETTLARLHDGRPVD